MKKLITLLLVLVMALGMLTACAEPDDTVIRVAYMQGPTGMGIAKMVHDNADGEKYEFIKYEDAALATADIIAGRIDMACLPSNNAATVYNTKNAAVKALAVNCLNSLYVMTKSGVSIDSVDDLAGQTIYTIKNGTPASILSHILEKNEINATVKTTLGEGENAKELSKPSDLAAALISGAVDIALVPEPVATAAPLKIAALQKDYTYTVALDLTDVWADLYETPITMGILVGNSKFVSEHKAITDRFLDEYRASIEFIAKEENRETAATYIVEAGVLDAAPAAKKSLANLADAIAYLDGDNMKSVVNEFYKAIKLALIGGKLPDDGFYYKK